MKVLTSVRKIVNSTYLLIPPDFVNHAQLEEGEGQAYLKDEEGKKGPYLSVWAKKLDVV